jgi:short-subunit dehydrogenase
LSSKNVQVMTVLPGFIKTKMTEQMELPGLLTADPRDVAYDIYKAFLKEKDVIYTKWFWRWIMVIIKSIPEAFFKKMKL